MVSFPSPSSLGGDELALPRALRQHSQAGVAKAIASARRACLTPRLAQLSES